MRGFLKVGPLSVVISVTVLVTTTTKVLVQFAHEFCTRTFQDHNVQGRSQTFSFGVLPIPSFPFPFPLPDPDTDRGSGGAL